MQKKHNPALPKWLQTLWNNFLECITLFQLTPPTTPIPTEFIAEFFLFHFHANQTPKHPQRTIFLNTLHIRGRMSPLFFLLTHRLLLHRLLVLITVPSQCWPQLTLATRFFMVFCSFTLTTINVQARQFQSLDQLSQQPNNKYILSIHNHDILI